MQSLSLQLENIYRLFLYFCCIKEGINRSLKVNYDTIKRKNLYRTNQTFKGQTANTK